MIHSNIESYKLQHPNTTQYRKKEKAAKPHRPQILLLVHDTLFNKATKAKHGILNDSNNFFLYFMHERKFPTEVEAPRPLKKYGMFVISKQSWHSQPGKMDS